MGRECVGCRYVGKVCLLLVFSFILETFNGRRFEGALHLFNLGVVSMDGLVRRCMIAFGSQIMLNRFCLEYALSVRITGLLPELVAVIGEDAIGDGL